jgi:hypothetical protein
MSTVMGCDMVFPAGDQAINPVKIETRFTSGEARIRDLACGAVSQTLLHISWKTKDFAMVVYLREGIS